MNNKGITWARNTRALNKGKDANHWDLQVDCMSNAEWERLVVKLALAWRVLKRHVSHAAQDRAIALNRRWAEEDNPAAAVFHAYGLVSLAEMLEPGSTHIDPQNPITWDEAIGTLMSTPNRLATRTPSALPAPRK